MPRTIDEGFRDFLSTLTPSLYESQAAKNHRASIEACLISKFKLDRFFRIGSFGNGTSISGHSDVDYLACLPSDKLNKNSYLSLSDVRAALDSRFPNTGVRVQSPAVVIPFGSTDSEKTEVVPAFYIEENNGNDVYGIPDSALGWKKASPDAHNAYVRAIDKQLNGKVKPLIRFIKAWKYYCNVPISSFYLELRVASYAITQSSIEYSIDVRCVFRELISKSLASMQDPMGVSGYIAACSSKANEQESWSKLNTAFTRASKARDAEDKGDTRDAFYWWQLVFSNRFPAYYK